MVVVVEIEVEGECVRRLFDVEIGGNQRANGFWLKLKSMGI